MSRPILFACVLALTLNGVGWAQGNGRNMFGGNGFANGGLGNAGGFATGPGMANSTVNTNNSFGVTVPRGGYGVVPLGPMQSIPGISNYGGAYDNNATFGSVLPGVGTGAGMPLGFNGMVPGIAPPGFTKEMFGYDVGIGGETGYTDFATNLTYSALGLGFGGMGYGPMAFGPTGFAYPGMVPGTFMPGVGYFSPADLANMNAMNAVNALNGAGNFQPNQPQQPARSSTTRPGATVVTDDTNGNAGNADNSGNDNNRPRGVRRSFLNDNVPLATANAIRIQNRLHNIKTPNLKQVKVLIANRTAILSGDVDSDEDAQLAVRMVGLEPGVVDVKNELVVRSSEGR